MPRRVYRKAMTAKHESPWEFLGELELTIMEIIWEESPVTVGVFNGRSRSTANSRTRRS